jgi:Spy/CpxP family protein refolding chaperone
MKDNINILKYLLIVSLLLNFSLLGAAGYAHYRQTRYGHPPFGFKGTPPFESIGHGYPFEKLSLKPEQIKLFQQKARLFHEALDKKKAGIYKLRDALLDLMRAENPDRRAIEAAIARISSAQEEMQEMVVSHMLEFKAMLDKDQQKKFLDLIEGAMTRRQELPCP